MSNDKKPDVDSETILIALDQISQTIDIMYSTVGRLRGYIDEQADHKNINDFEPMDKHTLVHKESLTLH